MSLGLVSPLLNRGVRSRWLASLPGAGSKMLTIDSNGDTAFQDIPTAAWGSITGTLSSQTDLQNALNAKLSLSGGTMTGAINVPLGAAATESIRFASNTGIYSAGEGFVNLNASGMLQWNGAAGQLWLAVNSATTQLALGSSADVRLFRDAAAILAQRNGTNAQAYRIYNTFTDASNYERGQLAWESNEFRIGSAAAGTGTQRNTVLGSWSSGGTFTPGVTVASTGVVTIGVGGANPLILSGVTGQAPKITLGTAGQGYIEHSSGTLNLGYSYADQVSIGGTQTTIRNQLNNTQGTITASAPLTLTQTWNNAAVTFTGALVNVTDTASASGSLLMDLQVGGSSVFSVDKNAFVKASHFRDSVGIGIRSSAGWLQFFGFNTIGSNSPTMAMSTSGTNIVGKLNVGASTYFDSFGSNHLVVSGTTILGGAVEQRSATNAQTFRVYNTYTDASNYERGKIEWSSNVLRIGTEKAGTGSARALELQTDGTTRLTIGTTGTATFSAGVFAVAHVINQNIDMRSDTTDGVLLIQGYDTPGFNRLQLGGTTSSFPAIKRNGTAINFRLADDSADAGITASTATFSGDVTVSAINIVTDTTTGTKIGTATTQKIGFWNATPVVQPAAVADATDAASVITQLNLLLSRMRDLGLIAT